VSTSPDPQLVHVRHGETAWSLSGQHTGTSDIPLTAHGEEQARASGVLLASRVAAGQRFRTVLTSPRVRARRTAELAGFGGAVVDGDLAEWDYGPVEGRTSDDISAETGTDWEIFRDGVHVVGADPPDAPPTDGSPPGIQEDHPPGGPPRATGNHDSTGPPPF
jgi:probable phosphoglycerate mutase